MSTKICMVCKKSIDGTHHVVFPEKNELIYYHEGCMPTAVKEYFEKKKGVPFPTIKPV